MSADQKTSSENQPYQSHYALNKDAHLRYQNSEKGKVARERYQNSDKGKAARKRYHNRRNLRLALLDAIFKGDHDNLTPEELEQEVLFWYPS